MQNWNFTFGIGNYWLKNKFVTVYGTFEGARSFIVNSFGKEWCSQYEDDVFEKMIKEYNYTRLGDIVTLDNNGNLVEE